MKKTIISIAVAFASFGAFANPSSQITDNAVVFGTIGASYDNLDMRNGGGEADTSGIEYLRNTEIGVKTSVELDYGVEATAVIVGDFDEDDVFGFDKLELGFATDKGTLHLGKIDNRYDLATSQLDPFNDVFSGYSQYELFTATGKTEGVAVNVSPVKGLEIGVQFGNSNIVNASDSGIADDFVMGAESIGEIGESIAATATYSVAGVDLSAGYQTTEGDQVDIFEDTTAFKFGAGYGIKGLYAGVVYESVELADIKNTTISVTGAYTINALTLKAGYAIGEETMDNATATDVDTLRLAAQYDLHENVVIHAGYARIDSNVNDIKEDFFTTGVMVKF